MKINVELSDYFKKYIQELNKTLELPEETDVAGLIDSFDIAEDKIGFVTVNNKKAELDYKLKEGDRVGIFPYIIGG